MNCSCLCVGAHLLQVFSQRDLQTFLLVLEHLVGHEAVEDGRAGQRDAEVETKKPPVPRVDVELEKDTEANALVPVFSG